MTTKPKRGSAGVDGWREVTLGDFAPFTYGKGLRTDDRIPSGGVPVIGSNGIIDYHDKPLTDGPTIVIGRKGTVGAVHYSPIPCWPIDTTFFITDDDPELLKFKYYALKVLPLQDMNSDSAVPGLNRDDAHACLLRVPGEAEQRAIAHVLGTLDDKIELNRRMNATLEAMARALFTSWFVDFEPVRAKMEGRWRPGESLPGLPAEHYHLFPDTLVPSPLGDIPAGWEVRGLGEVVEIYDNLRIPLNSRQRAERQGPYPYYGAAGIMDYVDGYLFDGEYVLMGEDGSVVDDEGYPIVQYVWGKFWANNHAHVLQTRHGVSLEQLYLFLKQVNITPYVTGAVQPKLSQTNLNAVPFLLPPQQVCKAFGDTVGLLFHQVRSKTDESRALAAQRDALLPRLVSGETGLNERGA